MRENLHGRTKTIGVLGGMGPAATVDFYRRIVETTHATRDQDHLHVLVDSQPAVPDRTAFLLQGGEDPAPALIAMARTLEQAGAELLVMACNTAGAFAPQVAAAVGVPLVDWVDEAATGVAAALPALRRIGLLATNGTVASGLYQRAFGRRDVDVIVPPAQAQEQVMAAIYGPAGVKAGPANLVAAREQVESAGRDAIAAGAEAILLACTELSVLFAAHAPGWPVPAFDAAQVVAERVIVLAGGRLKHAAMAGSSGSSARAAAQA